VLSKTVKEELRALTPEQREIVLKGLRSKMGHYDKTGKISYRYDICPVCADVGSTQEDPKCDQCYIMISCQVPFDEGFKEDPIRSAEYFRAMLTFIESI
jgi:hypothetical protein